MTTDRLFRITSLFLLAITVLIPASAAGDTVPVSFHWSPPTDGAPVYVYLVYASRNDEAFRYEDARTDTTFVLQAELGVEYRIRVTGVSQAGHHSEPSLPSEVVFLPEPQPEYGGPPPTPDLRSNYPNPFNPETTIRYGMPENLTAESPARLEIYDIRGQRVRMFDVDRSPGWHELAWDGRDERGDVQPSGHYVLRLTAGGSVSTWKMTMVK